MNRTDLLDLHKGTCARAFNIMTERNTTYASDIDPLKNFHLSGATGIIVHIGDKFLRLENLYSKEEDVETILSTVFYDSIYDIINYLILLVAYLETHGKKK